MMAAGLAARRLGAESPLHFGVAPQSTPRSARLRRRRPIPFRVTAAEPSRAPSLSISFRALRCIRLARGTPTSGSRTAGRLLFESPSPKPARLSRPAAGPAHGMRRAPRRRTCATAGRFGRGHRGCFGGGSGVARRARRSEGQGCCARCEIRWQLSPRKCREQTARSSPAGGSDGGGGGRACGRSGARDNWIGLRGRLRGIRFGMTTGASDASTGLRKPGQKRVIRIVAGSFSEFAKPGAPVAAPM